MALFGPVGGGGGILSYTQAQRNALSASNGQVIFNTTSLRVEQYDSTTGIWRYVGDPLSINYVRNYSGEGNATTGWATYADAAGTTPVDGTGGAPNVTWTLNTTSPLRGQADFLFTKDAANRQGQGVSYDFTIDSADQGRILQIAFDYKIASGTYASGDITIWVYDVTNGVLLPQPSGNSLISTSIPSQQGQCTFQTAINSTSYRLIFHVTTTSASAYTIEFDNINVGPQIQSAGMVDTDWVSYTPTFVGLGTVANVNIKWRRVGSNLEIQGYWTNGTVTGSTASMTLPSGLVIDSGVTTKRPSGEVISSGTAASARSVLIVGGGTVIEFGNVAAATINAFTAQPGSTAFNSSENNSFFGVSIPIAGWGSNTVLSTSANTRLVDFVGTQSSQAVTGGSTNITFTATADRVAGWATNIYTVQVPGDYLVSCSYSGSGASAIQIFKNGSNYAAIGQTPVGGAGGGSAILPNLVVGDTIAIRSSSSVTVTSGILSIALWQSPQQIAASESINARYFASSTSISGSLATIVWTTKDFDSHNAMASGVYTCPAPGKYHISAGLALAGTFVLNNTTVIEIQKNGSAVTNLTRYIAAAITNDGVDIEDTISCAQGDTIRIQVSNSGTTPSIVSSNTRNYFSIFRVGN